jgi:hypothetical protein
MLMLSTQWPLSLYGNVMIVKHVCETWERRKGLCIVANFLGERFCL